MKMSSTASTTSAGSPLLEDDCCSIPYFRDLLAGETVRLTEVCDKWEKKLELNKEIISDVTEGEMRSVIGQGRLVMAERFVQFGGLVDNCEFEQGEKKTTCMDLKGFWEMIYFQVEDVDRKFRELEKIEANDWQELMVEKKIVAQKIPPGGVTRKRASAVVKKVASAGLKALIAAKRKKANGLGEDGKAVSGGDVTTKEATKDMDEINIIIDKANDEKSCLISPEKTFDGGFFSIKSPSRHQITKSPTRGTQSTGCDKLRKSVLTESAKRVSGLVSPFVSQVARRAMVNGEKLSPVKDSRRSSLFEDFDAENEAPDGDENKEEVFSAAAL